MPDLARLLGPSTTTPADTYRFATITSTSPARLRLDGDTAPVPATPIVLGAPVTTGDRVWVQIHHRKLIVLGIVAPNS